MTKKHGFMITVFVVALFILTMAFSANALSTNQESSPLPIPTLQPADFDEMASEKPLSEQDQAAVITYWTRDEMLTTEATELLVDDNYMTIDVTRDIIEDDVEPLEISPSGLPNIDADVVAQQAYPEEWEELNDNLNETDVSEEDESSVSRESSGSNYVFTRYRGNKIPAFWKNFPYRAIGMLFTNRGSCTAANFSRHSVIVTAAHCVFDTTNDTWKSNKVFVPAYRNGSSPYGKFPTSRCFVLPQWVRLTGIYTVDGWARFDVAVCKMGKNSAGQKLSALWEPKGYIPYVGH